MSNEPVGKCEKFQFFWSEFIICKLIFIEKIWNFIWILKLFSVYLLIKPKNLMNLMINFSFSFYLEYNFSDFFFLNHWIEKLSIWIFVYPWILNLSVECISIKTFHMKIHE